MKITQIDGFHCKLGENPLWDVDEQALYGADALARTIWRHDSVTGALDRWQFSDLVGSFALRAGGGAIVALSSGLHFYDFATGRQSLIADPCARDPKLQLNDGKTDRAGRFLVGSVHTSAREDTAALYSVGPDGEVTTLDTGFIVTNGPCWSPDGSIFYFADSVRGEIYAYDYDLASGSVANRRLFASTAPFGGIPDGATVDAEGGLWSAICGGAKIVRFTPEGKVSLVIDLPTRLTSSVMFGGRDLDRLFVTSIDGAAAAAEIEMAAANPVPNDAGSGALFVIDGLGVRGIAERRFAG